MDAKFCKHIICLPITPLYWKAIVNDDIETVSNQDDLFFFLETINTQLAIEATYFIQRKLPFVVLPEEKAVKNLRVDKDLALDKLARKVVSFDRVEQEVLSQKRKDFWKNFWEKPPVSIKGDSVYADSDRSFFEQ